MAMRKANRGKSLKTGSVLQNAWFESMLPDQPNIQGMKRQGTSDNWNDEGIYIPSSEKPDIKELEESSAGVIVVLVVSLFTLAVFAAIFCCIYFKQT